MNWPHAKQFCVIGILVRVISVVMITDFIFSPFIDSHVALFANATNEIESCGAHGISPHFKR